MENIIFRREPDFPDEPRTALKKKIFNRKKSNMAPLISFFNIDEKSKLTKHLFNHDAGKFFLFMTELNEKLTWPEALALMEAECEKRNIDIYCSKARLLTDRIYQVFFPEDVSSGW